MNSQTQRTPLWQRVKAEVSILRLAERYAELRKSGSTRFVCRCLCGGNTDRHPSFMLYEKGNDFHCFACQAHGSVIDLEMLVNKLDFKAACTKLAQDFGIHGGNENYPAADRCASYVSLSAAPSARDEMDNAAKAALNAANDFYAQQLNVLPSVRNWLTSIGKVRVTWQAQPMQGRGLSEETLDALKIGYASGEGLARSLFAHGIKLREAGRAGLLRPNAQRQEHFNQRVIFPVLDGDDVVYLMGRAIRDEQEPKYLGLAEGSTHKRPMVYGDVRTRAVIVEGCFDVAALKQWRVDSTVGIIGLLGTAHEQLFARVPDFSNSALQIAPDIVALDQDWAGKSNALSLVAALNKQGRAAQIVFDLDRHESLVQQTRFDSSEHQKTVEQEIAVGRDILTKGLARIVHWANAGDSPGKLLQLGSRGHDLFAQALV